MFPPFQKFAVLWRWRLCGYENIGQHQITSRTLVSALGDIRALNSIALPIVRYRCFQISAVKFATQF